VLAAAEIWIKRRGQSESSRATRSNNSGRRRQRGTANAIGKGPDRQRCGTGSGWTPLSIDAGPELCLTGALPGAGARLLGFTQRQRLSERLLVLTMVIGRKNKWLQLLLDRKD
jgi:hypothetical protein